MKFIDIFGNLGKARRQPTGQDSISEAEATEPKKLTEIVRGVMRRVSALEASTPVNATEFEVDLGDGGTKITLAHGLNCPVRYMVTNWVYSAGNETKRLYTGLVNRGMCEGTWSSNTIANQTTGAIYKLKYSRAIEGVRFINTFAGSRTIRCSLWDSSGTRLTYKDITVNEVGVYEAIFDEPYEGYAVGTNFTVSLWNSGRYMWNSDTAWTIVPISISNALTLVHQSMFTTGGDAFPSGAWTGVSTQVEPILKDTKPPCLEVDSTSDANRLVLKSYVAGRAVIRVEPSQFQARNTND